MEKHYEKHLYESYKDEIEKLTVDSIKQKLIKFEEYCEKKLNCDKFLAWLRYDQVSNQYYLIDNQPFYEVVIKTNLPDKYLIENNIINLVFKMNQTTLYQEFRKEFNLWKN